MDRAGGNQPFGGRLNQPPPAPGLGEFERGDSFTGKKQTHPRGTFHGLCPESASVGIGTQSHAFGGGHGFSSSAINSAGSFPSRW